MTHRLRIGAGCISIAVLSVLVTATVPSTATARLASTQPKHGGSLTVVLASAVWPTLDPAFNGTVTPTEQISNAIFGSLFEPGPNDSVAPDLATGYSYTPNGLELQIHLRSGVTFQDGTPFNATAVAWNIQQDLIPANGCVCAANFVAVTNVVASGRYTVDLQLSHRDTSLPSAFMDAEPGYIISPTEVAAKGAGYSGQYPVGAGPFKVVSNQVSATIVLSKYTGYWEKGHPYLSQLTFTTASSDQTELDALTSGAAQIATGVTTPGIIKQLAPAAGLVVRHAPAIAVGWVVLNSKVPPLNTLAAREALLYATYPQQIVNVLYDGIYPVTQGQDASGEEFYEPTVTGFRGWNKVAKAQALVTQLGGLSLVLTEPTPTEASNQVLEALQTQWARAGIQVTVKPPAGLTAFLAQVASGNWTAFYNTYGSYVDPFLSSVNYFQTGGRYAGFVSSITTNYYALGTELKNPIDRAAVWHKLMTYVDTNVLNIPLYQATPYFIMTKSVQNYPTNQAENSLWENIWLK
jgi:peptide/nickel transport system substrate-binding protein